MTEIKEKNILIIGPGLMGGSIARKLTEKNNIFSIVNKKEKYLKDEDFNNVFDQYDELLNSDKLIEESDLIFITVPFSEYANIFKKLKNFDLTKKVILECGSVKRFVKSLLKDMNLDGLINLTHPICGSEKKSFSSSNIDLYKDKMIVFDKDNNKNDVLEKIFRNIGCNEIEFLECFEHDNIYAMVSHLPQFLAFTYNNKLLNNDLIEIDIELQNEISEYKRFRRIGYSDKEIWHSSDYGIFDLNKDLLQEAYYSFLDVYCGSDIIFDLVYEKKDLLNQAIKISNTMKQVSQKYKKYYGSGIKDFIALSEYKND